MSDITQPVANLGPAVAVMARSPCGARAPKSRLAEVLPNEADRRRLYAAFLQDVVSACASVDGATLRVAYTADGGAAGFEAVGLASDQLLPQRGDDLGARERGVFQDLFGLGFSPVVLIGSDLPTLPVSRIADAIQRLLASRNRIVLGPADDGVVEPGMIVTIEMFGETETFLFGNREIAADQEDLEVYPSSSPLGAAIMGLKVGESTTYTAPNGKQISVEVVAVETYRG